MSLHWYHLRKKPPSSWKSKGAHFLMIFFCSLRVLILSQPIFPSFPSFCLDNHKHIFISILSAKLHLTFYNILSKSTTEPKFLRQSNYSMRFDQGRTWAFFEQIGLQLPVNHPWIIWGIDFWLDGNLALEDCTQNSHFFFSRSLVYSKLLSNDYESLSRASVAQKVTRRLIWSKD